MREHDLPTTRFGSIQIEPEDVLQFPEGIWGLDDSRTWVLLGDAKNSALGWLQSTSRPELALAVVSPRQFLSDYQIRVARAELASLALERLEDAHALAIVSKNDHGITLNLKAPLLVNLSARRGVQVINAADVPLQYELGSATALRKSA